MFEKRAGHEGKVQGLEGAELGGRVEYHPKTAELLRVSQGMEEGELKARLHLTPADLEAVFGEAAVTPLPAAGRDIFAGAAPEGGGRFSRFSGAQAVPSAALTDIPPAALFPQDDPQFEQELSVLYDYGKFVWYQLGGETLENFDHWSAVDERKWLAAQLYEHWASRTDKVMQRRAAHESGIFHQPRYFDARGSTGRQRLALFTEIPLAGIDLEPVTRPGGCLVFEDPGQGFALASSAGGELRFFSRNTLFEAAAAAADEAHGGQRDEAWARTFLARAAEQPQLEMVKREDLSRTLLMAQREELVENLLEHPGAIYIKSSRTSGGRMVLRLSRDESGRPVLESDSPDALERLDNYIEAHYRAGETRDGLRQRGLDERQLGKAKYDLNFKAVLHQLLAGMEDLTIEEELPRVKRGEQLVEFRIICQRVPGSRDMAVTAHYAKVSDLTVAANVALGGRGERSAEVVRDIYRQQLPEAGEDEIEERTRATLAEMESKCREFATRYRGKLVTDLLFAEQEQMVNDFAIDLIPSWDGERQQISFSLLEVQVPYGYSGLREADPQAAERVGERGQAWQEAFEFYLSAVNPPLRRGGE